MSDQNIALVRRWFDEGVNEGDFSTLDQIFDPGVVAHEPAGEARGIDEGPRKAVESLRAGFPDFHVTVDDAIASEDKVAVRWTATGTHLGEFMGIAPTANQIKFGAIYIYRFVNGRIAEVWASPDALSLMRQLGA